MQMLRINFTIRLYRLHFELAIIQLGIEAILLQQVFVAALFDNVALAHHQNQISVTDGGKAVGNDEAGATLHQAVHGFLDEDLGTGVH